MDVIVGIVLGGKSLFLSQHPDAPAVYQAKIMLDFALGTQLYLDILPRDYPRYPTRRSKVVQV